MGSKSVLERYRFRKQRTQKKIFGTPERPRLSVYRSSKHIYAQVIDDVQKKTLVSASSVDKELKKTLKKGTDIQAATATGELVAKRAKSAKVNRVVFDRGGCAYHGRVKAVAEGARKGGLEF